MYRRLSTLTWVRGPRLFAKQSQKALCFQHPGHLIVRNRAKVRIKIVINQMFPQWNISPSRRTGGSPLVPPKPDSTESSNGSA